MIEAVADARLSEAGVDGVTVCVNRVVGTEPAAAEGRGSCRLTNRESLWTSFSLGDILIL